MDNTACLEKSVTKPNNKVCYTHRINMCGFRIFGWSGRGKDDGAGVNDDVERGPSRRSFCFSALHRRAFSFSARACSSGTASRQGGRAGGGVGERGGARERDCGDGEGVWLDTNCQVAFSKNHWGGVGREWHLEGRGHRVRQTTRGIFSHDNVVQQNNTMMIQVWTCMSFSQKSS